MREWANVLLWLGTAAAFLYLSLIALLPAVD